MQYFFNLNKDHDENNSITSLCSQTASETIENKAFEVAVTLEINEATINLDDSEISSVGSNDNDIENDSSERSSGMEHVNETSYELENSLDSEIIDEPEIAKLNENEFQTIDREVASIPVGSVVDEYLDEIQQKIKSGDISKKDFWIYPKSSYSIRLESSKDPSILCKPRVFLWFPHYFEKDLKCPIPDCSHKFKVKGFNVKPRARRIVDLYE